MKKLLAAILLALCAGAAVAQSNANLCFTLVPSAAHTEATINTATQRNASWRGVTVTPHVSARTSGTYTVKVQAALAATPTVFYDLLSSTAINTTGASTPLIVYPGVAAATNAAANAPLPLLWRVQLTGASTPSMTLSVSACLSN